MFELVWTHNAQRQYEAIRQRARAKSSTVPQKSSKQEGLLQQVIKTLDFLRENPRHPGLRSHPFHSLPHPFDRDGKVWESYVQNRTPGAYRVFWCYGPDRHQITVIAIVPHP